MEAAPPVTLSATGESPLRIRIASGESDLKSASAIYAKSWKEAYRSILKAQTLDRITDDFWIGFFHKNYKSKRFNIALVDYEGRDIAAGGFGGSRDYDDADRGEVTSIYLLPEVWGSGFGTSLMDFMVRQLQSQGYKKIHLWVLSDNVRAIRFYDKFGFIPSGNRKEIVFDGETKTEEEFCLYFR